jgi:hypothetical protein
MRSVVYRHAKSPSGEAEETIGVTGHRHGHRSRSLMGSERAFRASQSVFTLRQTRLTVSLPTAPPNREASARRTRRVLVAGKVGARDQRIGNKRAPLIGPQRLALPLRRLAISSVQPGARHLDLHPAEAD